MTPATEKPVAANAPVYRDKYFSDPTSSRPNVLVKSQAEEDKARHDGFTVEVAGNAQGPRDARSGFTGNPNDPRAAQPGYPAGTSDPRDAHTLRTADSREAHPSDTRQNRPSNDPHDTQALPTANRPAILLKKFVTLIVGERLMGNPTYPVVQGFPAMQLSVSNKLQGPGKQSYYLNHHDTVVDILKFVHRATDGSEVVLVPGTLAPFAMDDQPYDKVNDGDSLVILPNRAEHIGPFLSDYHQAAALNFVNSLGGAPTRDPGVSSASYPKTMIDATEQGRRSVNVHTPAEEDKARADGFSSDGPVGPVPGTVFGTYPTSAERGPYPEGKHEPAPSAVTADLPRDQRLNDPRTVRSNDPRGTNDPRDARSTDPRDPRANDPHDVRTNATGVAGASLLGSPVKSGHPKLLSNPTTSPVADEVYTVAQPNGTFSRPTKLVNNLDEEVAAKAMGFTVELPAPSKV
jgi:hypothetical protein